MFYIWNMCINVPVKAGAARKNFIALFLMYMTIKHSWLFSLDQLIHYIPAIFTNFDTIFSLDEAAGEEGFKIEP